MEAYVGRKDVPTAAECHELLSYDVESGRIFWRARPNGPKWWNTRYAGREAFTAIDTEGYRQGAIHGKNMRAQYVVWVMFMGDGQMPQTIDHINRVKTDNRIENLRAASFAENSRNAERSLEARAGSGITGVYRCGSMWRARVRLYGQMHNLGSHARLDSAEEAVRKFKLEHWATPSARHVFLTGPGSNTMERA